MKFNGVFSDGVGDIFVADGEKAAWASAWNASSLKTEELVEAFKDLNDGSVGFKNTSEYSFILPIPFVLGDENEV